MDPRIVALLDRAVHRASATEANAAIARVREEQGDGVTEAVSYEILLPRERPVEYLTGTVLPRMVYFLECRGSKLPHCPGVFVSLFVENEIYFVPAADVVEELSKMSGLSTGEMVRRYGAESAQ